MTHHSGPRHSASSRAQSIRSRRPVVLVCNPADDRGFCADAQRALAGGDGTKADGTKGADGARPVPASTTPEALAAALRSRYPQVVVRARDLSNEPFDAWYVYRDGRWTGAGRRVEGVA